VTKLSDDEHCFFPCPSPSQAKVAFCSSPARLPHSFPLALQVYDLSTQSLQTVIPIHTANFNPTRNQAFNGLMGYYNDFRMEWLDDSTILFNTTFDSMFGIFSVDLTSRAVARVSPVLTPSDAWRIAYLHRESGLLVATLANAQGCAVYHALHKEGWKFVRGEGGDFEEGVLVEAGMAACPYNKVYIGDGGEVQTRPVVVHLHGGPHGADPGQLTLLRFVLLKLGFVLLVPNFSGSAGYGLDYVTSILGKATETTPQ
jgi:acylaminoacyl-peptidase